MTQTQYHRRTPGPWAALAGAVALAGCAMPCGQALPGRADLASAPARLTADIGAIRLAPLAAHRIDAGAALDPTTIAGLAVLNNPDLKARRAEAKVSAAQAFAARLLPDPQVSANLDAPVDPANPTAYGVAPSLDLQALITHRAALEAARAASDQADLGLLWSEWLTAQQARRLAVTILADGDRLPILRALCETLDARAAVSRAALEHGDVTAALASADLSAALDARGALAGAEHDAAKARADLDALLGLAPDVLLALTPGAPDVGPDPAAVQRALDALPHRRPDLLALRAGYAAQDANLRKAIIARFPVLNLGFSRASDTSAVVTQGVAATFTLPLFNGGRGEVAIQSATRDQLAAEYQARLDQTVTETAAALRERDTARAQVRILEAARPALMSAAAAATAAYGRRDLDAAAWLVARQASLTRELALRDQRLALALADMGLETVLFLPSAAPAP